MPRPRLTAVVRRGLLKLARAAESPSVVIRDTEAERALEYVNDTCTRWHTFARQPKPSQRPDLGKQWVFTSVGWVQKPKKKRRRRITHGWTDTTQQ